MPWTAPVDRASNDVITASIWNQLLGATGNIVFAPTYYKYKTAAQSFAATTTYTDVTATSGSLAFAIAASEVLLVEFTLYLSTAAAGGYKFQLTGPASPVAVQTEVIQSITLSANPTLRGTMSAGSAFPHVMAQANGGAGDGNQSAGIQRYASLIVNGANAGTVTLQGAQNSASGTTTIDNGRMLVHRLVAA